jgi:hypothetical protein
MRLSHLRSFGLHASFVWAYQALAPLTVLAQGNSDVADRKCADAFAAIQAEVTTSGIRRARSIDNWQYLAAEARRGALKLAKEYGNPMGEYLRNHTPTASPNGTTELSPPVHKRLSGYIVDLLHLLTLDALEMHDDAARVALRMMTERDDGRAWLKVSFCSAMTRDTTTNMYIRYIDDELKRGRRPKAITFLRGPSVEFQAIAGNSETVELLHKIAKWWRLPYDYKEKSNTEIAAKHISWRLSLPNDRRLQREKDELLYWQTEVGHPSTVDAASGRRLAASWLVESGQSVSPEYLIERVDEIEGMTPKELRRFYRQKSLNEQVEKELQPRKPLNKELEEIEGMTPEERRRRKSPIGRIDDTRPALYLIGAQKAEAAIPAILALARRNPSYCSNVEDTLKEIGSPKAQEALRSLAKIRSESPQ